MSSGIKSAVSFAPETTWGTPVTPSKSIEVHPGDGLQADKGVVFPTGIKGGLHKNNMGSFKGLAKYTGSFETDFIPGNAVALLKSAMGALSSAVKGGETIVYQHTLTEASTKPSLTVEQAVSELVYRYAGAMATGFKFANKPGETLLATFPMMAKSSTSATAINPSYDNIRPLNFNDLGTTGIKIAGTPVTNVDSFELEYKNGLDMLTTLASGNGDPSQNYLKPAEMVGKLEFYLNAAAAAEYVNYLNKTTQSLQVAFTGDAIGVSSFYIIDITLPKVTYKAAKFPINDKYNLVSVDFEAEEDPSSSLLISNFVVTNLTTSY